MESDEKERREDLPATIRVFLREWPIVKSAPLSFAVIVFTSLSIGVLGEFFLYNYFIIPGKDATIESLKVKSEGGPTDSVKADWPPLTIEQIHTFVAALAPYRNRTLSVNWNPDVEARAFVKSVREAGDQLNWQTNAANSMDYVMPGLKVTSRPDDPAGAALVKVLNDSGYPAKLTTGNYDAGILNIFVGEKQ